MKYLWIATRKGLFRYENISGHWQITQRAFPAENVTMMLHDPRDGSVYVALNHGHFGGKMHRSRDEGQTWQEIAVPKYPPLPEGRKPDINAMNGKEIPWNLQYIGGLEPGGNDRPGVLWCGTIPGGLFKSTDHGDSWQINQPLWNDPARPKWFGGGMDQAGIHSICVDPRNSDHVSVGVSCGGVWSTRDGGNTWTICGKGLRNDYLPPEQAFEPDSQDVHRLVQCPAAPDTFWVQHHNGIFTSDDRGGSWREITTAKPSAFGFAVVVHPRDPRIAWFVPAVKDEQRIPADGKVVVTRTRDGGQSFDILARGLPQQDAYDIAFRHALDIDDTGNVLSFGSTTGNLWISENGGEDWKNLSTNLPPIYTVRFG